jgi:hypothetical protein
MITPEDHPTSTINGTSSVVWLSVVVPLLDSGVSASTLVAISYPVGAVLLLVA